MFREDFVSIESGEDYHLSYGAAKYANIRTFVMPHSSDPDLRGFSDDYFEISARGDTTKEMAFNWREVISVGLFKRGGARTAAFSERVRFLYNVVYFVTSRTELRSVAPLVVTDDYGANENGCAEDHRVVVVADPTMAVADGDIKALGRDYKFSSHFCFLGMSLESDVEQATVAAECARSVAQFWIPSLVVVGDPCHAIGSFATAVFSRLGIRVMTTRVSGGSCSWGKMHLDGRLSTRLMLTMALNASEHFCL